VKSQFWPQPIGLSTLSGAVSTLFIASILNARPESLRCIPLSICRFDEIGIHRRLTVISIFGGSETYEDFVDFRPFGMSIHAEPDTSS